MNNALNPSGGISVSPADLQTLLNLYQTAKWGELERTCVALVNRLPHVGVVWSFLGASVKAQGRLQEALEPHRKAADLLPNDAQVHFNFAVLLQELGQTEAATAAYLHALTIAPTWVECLFNLGLLSQRTGDATTARKHYQKALTVDPAYAPALFSLAVIDHQAGALSDAENGYRRLIEAHPQIAEAHYNLGNLLKDQQKLAEAAASYEVALQRNPGLAYAAASLGEVYRLQGDVRSATQWLAKALAMDQKLPDAHYSMGQLLVEQHQFEAAIAAFNRSLELRPDFAEAHVGLGGVLQQAGMYEQAEVAYTAAENLGHAGASVRKALMMPAIMGQWEDIHQSRSRLENRLEALINSGIHLHDPLREVGRTNFYLAYHGLNDKDLQVSIANFYTKVCPSLLEVDRVIPNSESRERVKKKPRVGFFSAFLYEHAISACFKNIIISLAKSPDIDVFILSNNAIDPIMFPSDVGEKLTIANDLQKGKKKIAALDLDVLIYLDIGMEPLSYFLAYARLAKFQCVLSGHPVTTGISNLDYYISADPLEPMDAAAHYSEKLMCMPHPMVYFDAPNLFETYKSREEIGLPDFGNIYLCPMRLQKLHPDFDKAILNILLLDAEGFVVFFEDNIYLNWRAEVENRFKLNVPDSIRQRIIFLPWQNNHGLLSAITHSSVVLDPFHFGIGSTAAQVYAVGKPVVTWQGPYMRGRVGAWLCQLMQTEDCIAFTQEDFASLAVKAANDKQFRSSVLDRINDNKLKLYETKKSADGLKEFILKILH